MSSVVSSSPGCKSFADIAEDLNAVLAAGGAVQVTTYLRSTIYRKQHAGWFSVGRDGNLYVRHGRSHNCLSCGDRLLVGIGVHRV